MNPSALVIGAGIGGLTTAIHLARGGMHVTVLEKNTKPGGRCDRFSREGHHFDTGPTLLVMPFLYETEFASLGSSWREMLDLIPVDPTYHLIFDDGSKLALTANQEDMRRQLDGIEPGSFENYRRYFHEGERHYRLAIKNLVYRDFRKASDFVNFENLPLIYQLRPFQHHYARMSSYFKEPRLKAAFTFQDVYMGLSPFEAPATFSMMSYTELAHGVYYPRGGMYQVVNGLMELARQAGVEFEFRAPVERIDLNSHLVKGVTLEDGRRINADVVIANADLPYVYNSLLPQDDLSKRLAHKRFSCSVISFFWGVDKRYDELSAHNLFLADDYRQNFTSIIDDLDLPQNPSLYVHAPTRLDPAMAPPGEDTLTAIVPVGHMAENDQRDWGTMRDRARREVFRRLQSIGIRDLEQHIKFEINYTPPSWKVRYNLMKGSTHGLCHNLTQLGYFRPSNRHPKFHNLYFVGASTHPGTGVPTAMISARLTSRRILESII
jgi:phytoene desaturase